MAPLLISLALHAQNTAPTQKPGSHFEVRGATRLAALAKLGSLANTTFLVEAEDLNTWQMPVALALDQTTVGAALRQLLPSEYSVREMGALVIVSSHAGARNRVLHLSLGRFTQQPHSISDLEPFLDFTVRSATGCHPQSYGWSGPPMDLEIPAIDLEHATFETVVSRVAEAPEGSMWLVTTEPTKTGCISAPGSRWHIGLYGFGRKGTDCQTPFREGIGRELTGSSYHHTFFPKECESELTAHPLPVSYEPKKP